MRESGVISARAAEGLFSVIEHDTDRTEELAAKLGVQRSSAVTEINAWPLARFTAFLEAVAADKGDPLFGARLGKTYRLEDLGPVGTLVLTSATLGDGLSNLVRYFSVLQSNTSIDFSISDGVARLSYQITDPTVKLRAQDAQLTIAIVGSILSTMLGRDVRPLHVDFQDVPAADVDGYRAIFRCPVRFGRSRNAIYFPADQLGHVAVRADASLNRRIEGDLSNTVDESRRRFDFIFALEAWMAAALSAGMSIEIENAASDFGLSLRSFQRNLSRHELNYLAIRHNLRCQLAKGMLRDTLMPITSIAHYLGYSETSSFCRQFRNSTNLSPSRFRHEVHSLTAELVD